MSRSHPPKNATLPDTADIKKTTQPQPVQQIEKQKEQPTVPSQPEETATTASAWPPPPRPRKRRSFFATATTIIITILASLLVISGTGLLLYGTTRGYSRSLRNLAAIETQQTSTVQAQIQGTAHALSTAQANIEATAAAQADATTQAITNANNATATATAGENLYSTLTNNTPTLDDPLTDSSGNGKWDVGGTDYNSGCSFQNQNYNVRETQQGYLQPCIAQSTSFSDFTYQVSITINEGDQEQAGILFRINNSNDAYYFFHIGTNGSYALDRYNSNGQGYTLIQGISDAINPGIGQSNQIAVVAQKNTLTFFANSQYVNATTDSNFTSGKIGVGVIDDSTPVDATFSDAQVWQNQGSNNS